MAPDHVESTMMAFSASIVNLSRGFMGEVIGVWVNKNFIGMTSEDLSKYNITIWIGIGGCLYE
eukprot:CAMPEP_0170503074 /NCGR_PEP_ID=MMETSP0208-20121228/43559_1 /TAXON_ID=197538 /ORGANISM="Strombidium inclinatum, Strain S3" /LENGTH=62 /DNA_ID=CAMNT_0010782527 /DNA_START=282 /DNA_END=467 /DNA_ORIENTATION=-